MDFSYFYKEKSGRQEGNWKGLRYSSNRWYPLKVEVRGDTFRAYLEGVLQFEQTDAALHARPHLPLHRTSRRPGFVGSRSAIRRERCCSRACRAGAASNDTTPRANNSHSSRVLTAGETAAKSAQKQWAERLKTPLSSTNSIGMTLALIPPGEFQMGSPKSERERSGNEQQHRVRITTPFYLGVYEVTQSEFETRDGTQPERVFNSGGLAEAATGVDTSRYPVETVTWYDAVDFCNKLSEKEGRRPYYRIADIEREGDGWIKNAKVYVEGGSGYRLPTERNGNTPVGPERQPPSTLARSTMASSPIAMAQRLMEPRNKVRRWAGPFPSAVTDRMHSDCTTCTATCGNCAGTYTMRPITSTRPSPIQPGPPRARTEWSMAGAGTGTRYTARSPP